MSVIRNLHLLISAWAVLTLRKQLRHPDNTGGANPRTVLHLIRYTAFQRHAGLANFRTQPTNSLSCSIFSSYRSNTSGEGLVITSPGPTPPEYGKGIETYALLYSNSRHNPGESTSGQM